MNAKRIVLLSRELGRTFARLASAVLNSRRLNHDICFLNATEMVRRMRRKELSAREVLAAHLAQIARLNPQVNAIVTLAQRRTERSGGCGGGCRRQRLH